LDGKTRKTYRTFDVEMGILESSYLEVEGDGMGR
jgi:hypothetical protein